MYSVLLEIQPCQEQWDAYLANAKLLRPALEEIPGFIDNISFRSLTRRRWILSMSNWRDEQSVVSWRARIRYHEVQERTDQILGDYRLRIGQITSDTRIADGQKIVQQRDKETGEEMAVTLVDATQTADWVTTHNPQEIALYLGFDFNSYGDCISWDVFDSVSSPGNILLLVIWKSAVPANDHAATAIVPDDARVRVVRLVHNYPTFDGPDAYSPGAADPKRSDPGPALEGMTDEYLLRRFIDAQQQSYDSAIHAIRNGVLDPAWMAFVFPRFVNCYHSDATAAFAIASLDEARAYLVHPLLGRRLRESLAALQWLWDLDIDEVLSDRDKKNLHSSLTLFAEAADEPLMRQMLAIWFGCRADETTIIQLGLRP